MFAVADGPPGVAEQHLSPQEGTSEGLHTPGPDCTAPHHCLQCSTHLQKGGQVRDNHHGTDQVLRQCADMVRTSCADVCGSGWAVRSGRTTLESPGEDLSGCARLWARAHSHDQQIAGDFCCILCRRYNHAHESKRAKSFRTVMISRSQVTFFAACTESRKLFRVSERALVSVVCNHGKHTHHTLLLLLLVARP